MSIRYTVFGLALLFAFINFDVRGDELAVAVPPEDVEVTIGDDSFAEFSAKETQFLTQSSEPQIPFHVLKILLPPDADLSTVAVAIENETIEQLPGQWDVRPVPPVAAWNGSQVTLSWPPNKTIVDGRDIAIYGADARFPAEWVGTAVPGEMREWRLVDVTIAAFQYNPAAKALYELVEGDLVVTFRLQPSARVLQAPIASDTVARDTVRRLTINFEKVAPSYGTRRLRAVPRPTYASTYAIISTNEIVSRSNELEAFIQSKQRRGFNVEVITENQWGGGSGDAAAESLRGWLKANYFTRNLEYVLLIGNPDPGAGDVPMKMLWPRSWDEVYRESPSDYYYADLTGNWDLDGDGLYGEYLGDFGVGGVDRNWEVLVGRIPYYGSVSDLDRILEKVRRYENAPMEDVAWRRNVLLPMKPSDAITPGYHLGEAIKDDFVVPAGWRFHRVYDQDYGLSPPPETTPTTTDNVTNVWSSIPFGAVFWWTHGWISGASSIMDSIAALSLNDSYPAFTFQASCCNAWPESTDSLAYTLLRNGGIVTIGATRVSWYWPGQTYYASSAGNPGMAYEYARRLISNELGSGRALYEMKQTLVPDPWMWMNHTGYNIYGDPSIGLFSGLFKINELVTFDPDPATYSFTPNRRGCPSGFVGKFGFVAQLANSSQSTLDALQIRIAQLSNGNLVLTPAGTTMGVGGTFAVPRADDYADGDLAPSEAVDVPFTVCLKNRKSFRFFVDVIGRVSEPE